MLAIISLSTTDIKNDELLMIGRSKKLRKKNYIAFETQDFNWHSVFPSIIAEGNIILFSHQKGAVIQRKVIVQGRRFFQILLTGSHALYILFYYSIIN